MKLLQITVADAARYAVALLELIGGALGIAVVVFVGFLSGASVQGLAVGLILLFVACTYGLSIVAGIALWKGAELGWRLSVIAQAMQLPVMLLPSLKYLIASGVGWWIRVGSGGLEFDHVFGSRFSLSISTSFGTSGELHEASVGINLVALTALLVLLIICRRSPQTILSETDASANEAHSTARHVI